MSLVVCLPDSKRRLQRIRKCPSKTILEILLCIPLQFILCIEYGEWGIYPSELAKQCESAELCVQVYVFNL